MTKITYIPGEIANAAIDEHGNRKPVTRTQHIFDDTKGKSQAEINAEDSNLLENHQQQLNNKYNKSEVYNKEETYSKNQLNNLITTPNQKYVTVLTYASLPGTGSADTVYRVSNYDGSTNQVDITKYSEYAWDGTQYIFLEVKTQIGEVFDISQNNANNTYEDLEDALSGTNVPIDIRRGGMSVKFIKSSDHKYVQFRLMSDSFNTTVANWQGVDDELTVGSDNLPTSNASAKYSRNYNNDLTKTFNDFDIIDMERFGYGIRTDETLDINNPYTANVNASSIILPVTAGEVFTLVKSGFFSTYFRPYAFYSIPNDQGICTRKDRASLASSQNINYTSVRATENGYVVFNVNMAQPYIICKGYVLPNENSLLYPIIHSHILGEYNGKLDNSVDKQYISNWAINIPKNNTIRVHFTNIQTFANKYTLRLYYKDGGSETYNDICFEQFDVKLNNILTSFYLRVNGSDVLDTLENCNVKVELLGEIQKEEESKFPDDGIIYERGETIIPYCGYFLSKAGNLNINQYVHGNIIEIPKGAKNLEVNSYPDSSAYIAFIKDFSNFAHNSKQAVFSDLYKGRLKVSGKAVLKLDNSCNYLYFTNKFSTDEQTGKTSTLSTVKILDDTQQDTTNKKNLNILFIGSSNEQEMIAYLPPILNELLYDYDITYGDMYTSSTNISGYINMCKNNEPCTTFNIWTPGGSTWLHLSGKTVSDVLNSQVWNLIIFKGTAKEQYRTFMRILQTLAISPISFATESRFGRCRIGKSAEQEYEEIRDSQQEIVEVTGIFDTIPFGTAIQNARNVTEFRNLGGVFPGTKEFEVRANGYIERNYRINPTDIITYQRLEGSGAVILKAGTYEDGDVIATINDNEEHTITLSMESLKSYLTIINEGADDCTIRITMPLTEGNYLMCNDNTHLQAGIPPLICAYTAALKILEWTGHKTYGINKSSFIPTPENVAAIGVGSNSMTHGEPVGIIIYNGSDGNVYDRSQLTDIEGVLYVTSTLAYEETPTSESITAVPGNINYENIYAAQEVAEISVVNPMELTDMTNIVIDVSEYIPEPEPDDSES